MSEFDRWRRTVTDVSALTAALEDPEPLVRSHAAWALGRISSDLAADALLRRLAFESESSVVDALDSALKRFMR